MKIVSLSNCRRDLDFAPRKSWPNGLPFYAWRGILLCGFQAADKFSGASAGNQSGSQCVDHKGELEVDHKGDPLVVELDSAAVDLATALIQIHGTLTLPELARLRLRLNQGGRAPEIFVAICQNSGLRLSGQLEVLLSRLTETPREFQEWASARTVAPAELLILNSLDVSQLTGFLTRFAHANPNRNTGAQILECALELFMMGHEISTLDSLPNEAQEVWLERLAKVRRPVTGDFDAKKMQEVRALSWPQTMQAKWTRNGDQGAVEIKFQIHSNQDFQQKIYSLERVAEQLGQRETPLWNL